MTEYAYIILNGRWKFCSHPDTLETLGVLISVDKKELYEKLNDELCPQRTWAQTIEDSNITLQKHGIPELVKQTYLTYVDSPLREFCEFHYIELKPTEINCININKIISTSLLPYTYLKKLITESEITPKISVKECYEIWGDKSQNHAGFILDSNGFVINGEWPTEDRDKVNGTITAYGRTDKIDFIGYVQHVGTNGYADIFDKWDAGQLTCLTSDDVFIPPELPKNRDEDYDNDYDEPPF